jgi:DNA modification methylase
MIAAEQTHRRCLGIELDPTYVDLVIRRWQAFTGKTATLDGDGRDFEALTQERLG